jgi:hypothetical protein
MNKYIKKYNTHIHTDRQTDRQTDRPRDRQTDIHTYIQTYGRTDGHALHTDIHTSLSIRAQYHCVCVPPGIPDVRGLNHMTDRRGHPSASLLPPDRTWTWLQWIGAIWSWKTSWRRRGQRMLDRWGYKAGYEVWHIHLQFVGFINNITTYLSWLTLYTQMKPTVSDEIFELVHWFMVAIDQQR